MINIHVEPDQLYLTSRTFWQANYRGLDHLFQMRVALARLQMTWISSTADEFFADIAPVLQQMAQRNEQLLSMALILSRQAEQWTEADQRWSGVFQDFQGNHPGG